MFDGRKRTSAVAAFLIALAGIGFTAATPAQAEPDLKTVEKQVDALHAQAEVASERYNDANVDLASSRAKMSGLNADLARQSKIVAKMRQQVATMVVEQFQGQALDTASQLVLSSNPDAFLDNLNAVQSYNSQRSEVMNDFKTQVQRLELRRAAVKTEVAQLAKVEKVMATQKAKIEEKEAAATKVLDTLKAKERAKLMAGGSYDGPLPNVPASGRAGVAVAYAMAQRGDAYVWGATGPNAFDCSGLMMAAWGQAGVGLPHSSSAQQGSGARVSEGDLQPGDLVFYYSPVHHVGMYIGNGLIVHAANPSAGVKIDSLHSMPYSGAVRPG